MKRRLKALLMALVLMVTSVISLGNNVVTAKADEDLSLVFHFTGGTSPEYYMWIWTIGDGVDVKMNKVGDEWTATLDATSNPSINSSTTVVNYIVKTGKGWESGVVKDVDADRSIDMSKYVSGKVDVYLESGVSNPTVDDSNAVKGFKLKGADTTDCKVINITSGTEIEGDLNTFFKVKDTVNNTYVDVEKVELVESTDAGCKYALTLVNKLDVTGSYQLEYGEGLSFMVGMPDYYATEDFESAYTYTGNDLGATYTKESTSFRVWAPLATDVKINLYKAGTPGVDDKIKEVAMTASEKGTWVAKIDEDLNGVYYTYTATINGTVQEDIVDPYARTTGVNGDRGMIIDLDSTDPEGWSKEYFNPFKSPNYVDAILYELHIRDFSINSGSGMKNKGKYLAFTEKGTKNSFGQTTGIDYLKDLGITHVHLLPTYDYATVDETNLEKEQFNWGYDPKNFNTPEGSYSTDPYNGEVRVKEFKQMVQAMQNEGIAVVMDVVYGHVSNAGTFSINRLTPSYYSRPNSSASGCGNDTATERLMNRKFIVDSFVYWATEYHINGFRIDQEGLFDIDTINEVIKALHEIDPNIIVYGEGWNMDSTNITKDIKLANQAQACDTIGSGYFSDSVRDALKGGVFDLGPGYVTGDFTKLSSVLNAIIANPGWQWDPNSVVNYNSCHDNYTLFDRITITEGNEEASFETRVKQNNLAAAMANTMQGISFIHAGEEILRSKPDATSETGFQHNSYNSPDAINSIKWDTLNEELYATTYNYYKGLIALRKAHAGFRMTNEKEISEKLTYILEGTEDDNKQSVIAFNIAGGANGEASDGIVVIYNPGNDAKEVKLPDSDEWGIYVQGDKAGTEKLGTAKGSISAQPLSCTVLIKNDRTGNAGSVTDETIKDNASAQTGDSSAKTMVLVGFSVVALATLVVLASKKRKELN